MCWAQPLDAHRLGDYGVLRSFCFVPSHSFSFSCPASSNLLCALALLRPLFLFNPDSPGREEHPSRERTMEAVTPQPVCAKEALALLNCTVETPFDRDKCLRLLDSLRSCVLEKVLLATHRVLAISVPACLSVALGVGTWRTCVAKSVLIIRRTVGGRILHGFLLILGRRSPGFKCTWNVASLNSWAINPACIHMFRQVIDASMFSQIKQIIWIWWTMTLLLYMSLTMSRATPGED